MKRLIWSRFLRRCFSSRPAARTRATSKRLPRTSVRPNLEALEERTLLSTYTVNQLGDSGAGSGLSGDIRYCINQANLNSGSTVTFDTAKLFGSGGKGTITLNNGELPIKVDMTIQVSGSDNSLVTISGKGSAGSSRIFDVTSSSANVIISNLTITNGNAEVSNTTLVGNQGGDIFNGGKLTLINDVVSNGNSSGAIGGPTGRGGAIYNAEGTTSGTGAQLTLEGTIVENSFVQGSGSQGIGEGGGIYNDTNATLIVTPWTNSGTMVPSIIRDNTAWGSFAAGAGLGGGIFNNTGATLNLNGTSAGSIVFEDNLAQGFDGISWGASYNGGNGKHGGTGGKGLAGTSGGNANGGGVFNTGVLTLQYTSFLGNKALAGNGGSGGNGGNGGSGTSVTGGTGGAGGTGGTGGTAQGGGLYNGVGALSGSNIIFGVDAAGTGNEALAGKGGAGGAGGAGGQGKTLGGKGGVSGVGGAGGVAEGGAMANGSNGGNVSFTNSTFTSNKAIGGNANDAGAAGNAGLATASGKNGGAGGAGRVGGRGGDALGGAVYNPGGNTSFTNSAFAGNQALGGVGGKGGNGGGGGAAGAGSSKIVGGFGGVGGSGGIGGNGGDAQGGGFFNVVGTVTINGSTFTTVDKGTGNEAISGDGGQGGAGGSGGQGGDNASTSNLESGGVGGSGGSGGTGGNGGLAAGGAGANQGGDTNITSSVFTSNEAITGDGGAGNSGGTGGNGGNGLNASANGVGAAGGNGGVGGTGGTGLGGALAVTNANLTIAGTTTKNTVFGGSGIGNEVVGGTGGAGGVGGNLGTTGHASGAPYSNAFNAGQGGQGGQGAAVYGGALSASGNTQTIAITQTTFANNVLSAGAGGVGARGGLLSRNGASGGLSGQGGSGGLAQGGAIALSTTTSQTATFDTVAISSNTASAGAGGAGNINVNSKGSSGGSGGSVQGVGLSDVNYNLIANSSSITGGTGTAGIGGAGGSADAGQPLTFGGGTGGAGGTATGGGVYLSSISSGLTSMFAHFSMDSISNNTLSGGGGGGGGNAGASGRTNISGGAGANGGMVQGGGIYIVGGATSVNTTTLSYVALSGNAIAGGAGGNGGAGYNAAGGNGGSAEGGAVYNTSLNVISGQGSFLTFSNSTVSGNNATGGVAGYAGSGTTPNGGAGGSGGNGGNADGAGLFNGNDAPLTVVNSTFGGGSTSKTASANYNILTGGNGGSGGNAGTPSGVPSNNGGNGGVGGSVAGGNVYNLSANAVFINDTLVYGQAVNVGVGGPGGSGAGKLGQSGGTGASGTGSAGGYYAAAGSSNTVGNTIIALDNAADATSLDVAGAFISLGNNILGSNAAANGFTKRGDQDLTGTPTQVAQSLNLGPLQNNGGFTSTDALLNNGNGKSVAIDAGGNTLVTSTSNPWHNLFLSSLSAPAAPTLAVSNSGGSWTAQTAWVLITYVNANGETTGSVLSSIAVPANGILTINSPAAEGSGAAAATGWYAYVGVGSTQPTNTALYRQQAAGSPTLIGTNLKLTANPTTTGANPPTSNTAFVPPPNDQRGPGFSRIYVKVVDVGAFEFNPPIITGLNPPSAPEQLNGLNEQTLPLTISGTGFIPGATVNWTLTGNLASYGSITLTPATITNTAITVNVPVAWLPDEGAANVTVSVPDGSGVAGATISSTPFSFTISEGTTVTLSNPGAQTNNESDSLSAANKNTKQITSSDPDTTFNDLNSQGQHTLPTGLSIDPNTGIISGTIAPYAVTNNQPTQVFQVTINGIDNGNIQGTINFNWTVNDTTPPTLVNPGNLTNNENDLIQGPTAVTIGATDADTGTFTDVVNGKPTLPTGLTINANGVISGTISPYAVTNGQPSQVFNVVISASDNGNVGITKFTWTVNDTTPPALSPPSGLVNGALNNNEGDTVNVSIQATDADSFSATGLPTGLSIGSTTGTITGTIGAYAAGTYNTVITATDNGYSSNINFTWNVADTTPPSFTNPGAQNNNEGDAVSGLATKPVDADPGSITDETLVSGKLVHTLPTGLSIDPNTGIISGTIDPRAAETYNVTISATDGTNNIGSIQFTWTVADTTPPSFTNPGTLTNNEGDSVTLNKLAPVDADAGSINDLDSKGQHTLPPGLSINGSTGVITGTIGKYAAGTYNVTLSATDGTGNVGTTNFTWIVNDTTPPSVTNPGDQNGNEGDKVSLPIRATDAESFSAIGLPTGLSIDSKSGLISGIIDPYGANTYHVTVTANDGTLSTSVKFSWNVADSSPPSFTNPGTQNNNEGDSVNLALNPVDADSGSITATGLPTGLSIDPNTGIITGVIDPHAGGNYNVTVSATDGSLTGNTTFTWNVADTTPPSLTSPGVQRNFNDTPISLAIHAVDADSFSATGLPAGLSINPSTGVISGTLLASAGTYQVTVHATDGSAASSITFPWVVSQMPIAVAVTNVHNTYVGLYQVETVTAQVSNPAGISINQGFVTFVVNGQSYLAPVNNGFAVVTFATPLLSLDSTILGNDFNSHALDAVYGDPAGIFGSGGASVIEPAMLLDFLLFLESAEFSSLAQQLAQFQSS